jgi:glycosyltransferase involved in cell wall biosynthesis
MPIGVIGGLAYAFVARSSLLSALLSTSLVSLGTVMLAAIARQWVSARRPMPRCAVPGGTLVIVIPARNEAATIRDVITNVPRDELCAQGWHPSVVVVDDGSSDGTVALARAVGAEHVISHPSSLGLGAALRSGLTEARRLRARAAVYIDADGEYDPRLMPRLLGPIATGEADYVLASRFQGPRKGMRQSRAIGNRGFTLLTSALCGRWLTDAQTGYRAFSGRALERAQIVHDYNYAQMLTLNLLRKRMRMVEVPGTYQARGTGQSFIRPLEYCRRVLPAIVAELLSE